MPTGRKQQQKTLRRNPQNSCSPFDTIKMFTVLMIPLSAMLSSTTALEKAGQQLDFSLPLILFLVLPLSASPLPAFPFKTSIRFTYRAVQSSHTDQSGCQDVSSRGNKLTFDKVDFFLAHKTHPSCPQFSQHDYKRVLRQL